MIEVKIKNVASQQYTHGTQFETLELAQEWITRLSSHPAFPWGKPEHQQETEPGVFITIPSEFEVEIEDITEQIEAEQAKLARIEAGKAARETCLKVLDMVAGYNLERELTIQQISSMATTLGQPMQALQAGRPGLAKQLIQAITADEIVTQEMIDEALELLAGY